MTKQSDKAIVCVQCALKAIVAGEAPPLFFEPIEEHMRKHHPDPEATARERRELERKLEQMNLKPKP